MTSQPDPLGEVKKSNQLTNQQSNERQAPRQAPKPPAAHLHRNQLPQPKKPPPRNLELRPGRENRPQNHHNNGMAKYKPPVADTKNGWQLAVLNLTTIY